ncbi:ABC transporter ATP-binding protein [Pinibacter aurantiacus]|uniref:ABC transporter ATP-binding protein n=1 Tax=Pinibacter aurantiacus TaxID=2851599 RepID=A0A9E2W298_9BACT|nr:ABC transporter ATP-binding protein [Pinibacter aurantiacus]MBV4357090.1 ABC transporter ATP-binding protein [Pinibacter aurantiacus]
MQHTLYENQLQEVHGHYNAGDFDLAHRRLLDCVIETADMPLFEKALTYCEWLDANGESSGKETIRSKAFELLETLQHASIIDGWKESNQLLTATDISKKYSKGNFALNNIDVSLSKGEIIGLVGENGNGKTTLMRLLNGELKAEQGKLDYHFAKNDSLYELRSKLLYVPQRIPRWWGSLMENLQFTLAQHGVKDKNNLLWAEIMVARLGLRPYKNLSWTRLSSGYRTRFELAKTLLRNPQILLLDEPLANLDINAQQTILQDLKFLSGSISRPFGMMISSQHIYEVEKVSDSIIFLKNGHAQYQQQLSAVSEDAPKQLVLEMEASADRNVIAAAFAELPVEKIQYNGNVFIIYFQAGTSMQQVLSALANNSVEVTYLRDISNSSRRFFAN